MSRRELIEFVFLGLAIVAMIGFAALFSAKFEAEVFNKCTGSNATYFDALFSELRIEDCDTKDTPND